MLCEICRKNKANVHITKMINGVKQKFSVCEGCAKDIGEVNSTIDNKFEPPFTLQNLLSGLMDYINEPLNKSEISPCVCKNCGTTYTEFKKKGLVGCSQCYIDLKLTLIPVIKRIQGNGGHAGKIPKRSGSKIIEKKKVLQLKENLKKAIELEKYEDAAKIRDMLKDIEKNNQEE